MTRIRYNPADTQRNNNVIMTSRRRRFDAIMTLSLRRVSIGGQIMYKGHQYLALLSEVYACVFCEYFGKITASFAPESVT